jgi:RimJ/RimL family protein N-acetyltransferase
VGGIVATVRFPRDVPVLKDGTVTLRAHNDDDLDGIYGQCNDPLSQQFTSIPVPYMRDDARRFVESRQLAWERSTCWSFAIESPWGVGPSGFSGSIDMRDRGSGIAEIGYGAHPDARGHGVMTRAVRLIADWVFDEQGIRTIIWEAYDGNVASRRVAWKTGFTFEGATRGSIPQRQSVRDGWRATLLATDTREPKTRWIDPVTIEDDRVRLRELQLADERRYLETNNDPETLQWLGTIPFPRDGDRFRRHLARRAVGCSLGEAVEWAIADIEDDFYVGSLTLFGMGRLDYASAEVGYRVHPDSRGRGLLTAALMLALDHAFAVEEDGGLGLQRISLNAGVGNTASQRVAVTCGFSPTGRDRQNYELYDGTITDLARFDLLRSEFHPRHLPR